MSADLAVLDIQIRTQQLEQAVKKLEALESAGKGAEQSTKSLTTANVGLEGSLKRVAAQAAAYFGAFKLAGLLKDSALLAARYQTLGVTMEVSGRNAGYNAQQMAGLEKSLRSQGIAAIESREVLTRMAAAYMDLGQASKLARASQDLAVAGGINSSEAFERMTYAIQSGQTEMLRTLGLNVTFDASYKALAKSLGKNVNALTEQEKMQARVNVVLQASAGYAGLYERAMSTAGKQITSFSRYWSDMQVELGNSQLPAVTELVREMTARMKEFTEYVKRADVQERLSGIGETAVNTFDMLISVGKGIGTVFESTLNGWNSLPTIIQEVGLIGAVLGGKKAVVAIAAAAEYANIISDFGKTPYEKQNSLVNQSAQDAGEWIARITGYDKEPRPSDFRAYRGPAGNAPGWASSVTDKMDSAKTLAALKLLKGDTGLVSPDRDSGASSALDAKALARLAKQREDYITKWDDAYAQATLSEGLYLQYQLQQEQAAYQQSEAYLTGSLAKKRAMDDAFTMYRSGKLAEQSKKEDDAAQDAIDNERKLAMERMKAAASASAEYGAMIHNRSMEYDARIRLLEMAKEENITAQERLLIEQKISKLTAQKNGDILYAARDALTAYGETATDTFANVQDSVSVAFGGMEDALVQFVTKGKVDFSSLADSIIADLVRIQVRQSITGPIAKALGSMDLASAFGFHSGGVIGQDAPTFTRNISPSVFVGAPRLHNGLMSDEFPAILQKGETVIPKGQGAVSTGAQNITVKLVNRSGQQIQASSSRTSQNGQETIVEVMLDAVIRNVGGARTGLQQALGRA